ncbi:hypothetical protein [Amycolatopsis palatopharyngis]|uniref:hypothetical protein n=1 Tax=Amycolatopsis palatopharyngis TaxID=187982 RepID=UPI0013BE94F0|nr:hypothetical protein [Amycolatopsis palatopharyngis]
MISFAHVEPQQLGGDAQAPGVVNELIQITHTVPPCLDPAELTLGDVQPARDVALREGLAPVRGVSTVGAYNHTHISGSQRIPHLVAAPEAGPEPWGFVVFAPMSAG